MTHDEFLARVATLEMAYLSGRNSGEVTARLLADLCTEYHNQGETF